MLDETFLGEFAVSAHSSSLSPSTLPSTTPFTGEVQREDFSEYVAHLQLHMALQTRNLLPSLSDSADSRNQLLEQTQADIEKQVSRQVF